MKPLVNVSKRLYHSHYGFELLLTFYMLLIVFLFFCEYIVHYKNNFKVSKNVVRFF